MTFDPWQTDDRILAERANGVPEAFSDYIESGIDVSDAGGLTLQITEGVAYICGWRVKLEDLNIIVLVPFAEMLAFFSV